MKIKRFPIPEPITLKQFAEKHNLILEIHERTKDPKPDKYYAHFENSDIKDGRVLRGVFGNGSTEAFAISDYAKEISGQILILNAWNSTKKRREIHVPTLETGELQ